MEFNDKLFLTDEEIKLLSIYLVFGVFIGIIVGAILSNVQLFFSLGGVVSILISFVVIIVKRNKKLNKFNEN